jgi:nitroimidazol reductase NimA-like FMN-containing flavoprotein (pyridoxamine 5'-phosphate oxidase superfamily)
MRGQRRNQLQELTREECLALLRGSIYLGRIGYVVDGVPVIVPVNFVLDGDTVVFCTTKGSKLSWLSNHTRIAFQADQAHALDQSGWSALIRGTAQEVTDAAAVRRLRRGSLRSWTVSSTEHWVRITVDHISGRRLGHRLHPPSANAKPGDLPDGAP